MFIHSLFIHLSQWIWGSILCHIQDYEIKRGSISAPKEHTVSWGEDRTKHRNLHSGFGAEYSPDEAERRTEGQSIQVGQEERERRYSSERTPEREVNEGQVPEEDISRIE